MKRPGDGYPLAAVETLREHAETSATEALAEALRELSVLQTARDAALRAVTAHRRAQDERDAPASRRTTAAEWAREQAYRTRQREREKELLAALDAAAAAVRLAQARVSEARRALGGAATERAVVKAHRARWQKAADRARAQKEEDERDEWRRP